jgi:hypothetical protein
MKTSVLVAVLGVLALRPDGGPARPRGIPARLYPRQERIVYEATVSNARLDCAWGFDCSRVPPAPTLHCSRQDALGRVGGWLQTTDGDARYAPTFALAASTYPARGAPTPASRARADLAVAAEANGFVPVPPPPLPGAHVTALRLTDGDVVVDLLGADVAGEEVEGYVLWTRGHNNGPRLERDLVAQVRYALRGSRP